MRAVNLYGTHQKRAIEYSTAGNYKKNQLISVSTPIPVTESPKALEAAYYGVEYPIVESGWDAEKNQGELGAPKNYDILYESVSARGWQIYQDSDIAKMLVKGYVEWVLGSGLKAQAEPIDVIIENEGYEIDKDKFTAMAEARTRLHFKTRHSAHNGRDNLHLVGAKALKSIIVGGDGLVIYRYNKGVTTEFKDGKDIRTPYGTKWMNSLKKGNRIIHGVEVGPSGEHVAFYLLQDDATFERVLAKGPKTGRIQAIMLYGDEYRVDGVRGLPLYASSIEKLKKIDRYIEAVVSGTEERAKVAYQTVHNHFSDGSDPLARGIEQTYTSTDANGNVVPVSLDTVNRQIFKSTNKMAINNTPGSEIKTLESTVELHVGPFLKDNLIYIAASMGIPYEVAVMMYENSFSASRMASQSFQQIINNHRDSFVFNYYKPAYDIQIENDILSGKLQADGYFNSIQNDDPLIRESYLNARFSGHNVPQADPSKEVKAVILMLDRNLITHEQAAELLSNSDFGATLKRLGVEYKLIQDIIPIEYQRQPNGETDDAEFTDEPKA